MDYFSSTTNNNPYAIPSSTRSSSSSSSVANRSGKVEKKRGSGSGGKRPTMVKLSTDPQSVAARERRHRISDRFKILQSLVPGGTKMDTVSMLDEAIHYVKFLKTQIWLHQTMINVVDDDPCLFPTSFVSATTQENFCSSGGLIGDEHTTPVGTMQEQNFGQGGFINN